MKHIFKYIFIIAFFGLTGIKCKSPDRNLSLPEPNPASAEITLDTVSSTTETIGTEGGKIEIVGTDGLEYLFTIPKGFLMAKTEITMTPIASLTSPLLEKFTAGVHFEPDGLVMPGVAWLEISGGVFTDKLVGITYEGKGDEVGLSWAELDGSTIRIPISHFSGAGAGKPDPGAGYRPPTNAYRGMTNALIAAYIDNDYNCIGKSEPIGKLVIEWYKALLITKIIPNLEAAANNDLVLADAIGNYIDWIAWPQWMDSLLCFDINEEIDGRMEAKAEELIKTGLENAMDTATDYCAKSHDISETTHMINWVAASHLLEGLIPDVMLDTNDLIERIKDCLTFELQFSSHIEIGEGTKETFSCILNSTIKPLIPEAQGQLLGWISEEDANQPTLGPLEYEPSFKNYAPGCDIIFSKIKTEPAAAFLPGVIISKTTRIVNKFMNIPNQEENEQEDDGDDNKEVMLIFYPLEGSEHISATCLDADLWGSINEDGTFGTFYFNELYKHKLYSKYGGYRFMLEKQGPGKLYARKTIDSTRYEEGVKVNERTSFELFHKPKGGQ